MHPQRWPRIPKLFPLAALDWCAWYFYLGAGTRRTDAADVRLHARCCGARFRCRLLAYRCWPVDPSLLGSRDVYLVLGLREILVPFDACIFTILLSAILHHRSPYHAANLVVPSSSSFALETCIMTLLCLHGVPIMRLETKGLGEQSEAFTGVGNGRAAEFCFPIAVRSGQARGSEHTGKRGNTYTRDWYCVGLSGGSFRI